MLYIMPSSRMRIRILKPSLCIADKFLLFVLFDFEMECPFTIPFNITKTAAYPFHYCSIVYI